MKSLIRNIQNWLSGGRRRVVVGWRRYRSLRKPYQIIIAIAIAALLLWGITLARSEDPIASVFDGRTVTLATVAELSGNGSSVDLIGTVRSITEAEILAETSGTVRAVRVVLGGRVAAGGVIAELENASERASVLSAEGAYEAAVAARDARSLTDTQGSARETYRSTFTTLDTAFEIDIDTFFGEMTAVGPDLLIFADSQAGNRLSRERQRLDNLMKAYERNLETADSRDPGALLDEAEDLARATQAFLTDLAETANKTDSQVTAAQLTALSSARSDVDSVLASIMSARATLRSGSVSATASADAAVKQALGSLRSAQAALERTIVRAPIAGQINFLPIRVGDYVTATEHVATVAQNGTLEILAYVSEEVRDLLEVRGKVVIEGQYEGTIASIAPALDPNTKQIEVRIAVAGEDGLVNGQTVSIALPGSEPKAEEVEEGPVLLPLAAVKLRAGDRIIFTVGEDNRLIAHPVEVGEVRGDRIEIMSDIDTTMHIVSDARGLSEGEEVKLAPAEVPTAPTSTPAL